MLKNYVDFRGVVIIAVVAAIVCMSWYGYYSAYQRPRYNNTVLFRDIYDECMRKSRSHDMRDSFIPSMNAHDILAQIDLGRISSDKVKKAITQGRNLYGNAYYISRDDNGNWLLCDPENDQKYNKKSMSVCVFSESLWRILSDRDSLLKSDIEYMTYDPAVVLKVNTALAKYLHATTATSTQLFSPENPSETKSLSP